LRALIYRTGLTVSAESGICYNTAIGPAVSYCHEKGPPPFSSAAVVNLGLPSVAPLSRRELPVFLSASESCAS